mgnify:CR=1 FL=1
MMVLMGIIAQLVGQSLCLLMSLTAWLSFSNDILAIDSNYYWSTFSVKNIQCGTTNYRSGRSVAAEIIVLF